MKVTPLEIEKMEFKSAIFGYDKKQIRNFLNEIANDLTELIKENAQLKEKIVNLEKIQNDYQAMEKKLQSTLLIIQEFKESIQKSTEREAEQKINETKLQCNVMIKDAERKVSDLKKEIENLLAEKKRIISKIRLFLTEELAIVKNYENEPNIQSPVSINIEEENKNLL